MAATQFGARVSGNNSTHSVQRLESFGTIKCLSHATTSWSGSANWAKAIGRLRKFVPVCASLTIRAPLIANYVLSWSGV